MADESIQVPEGLTTSGLLGRRYFARAIDTIVVGAVVVLFLAMETALLPPVTSGLAKILLVLNNLILILVIWVGYSTGFESSAWQATLGKRAMGLRVYDRSGQRLGFLQAGAQNLVKDGPFLALSVVPGNQVLVFLWLGAHLVVMHRSPVYQAIHDRVAGTWVAAPEEMTQLRMA